MTRTGRSARVAGAVPPADRDRPDRWILHADMDAFYAAVEQRDRPELRGRPVIVGGTSRRGVVSAASYQAREYGVRSAMPTVRARQLCPRGVFLPPDMARYARVSDQVHRVFEEFTPDVEPLSLDEAFLDVTGSLWLFGTPADLGRRLKARVREQTGLAVSVGIGPSKLVAKIACTLSKPDGLRVVAPGEVRDLLDPLPVRRLWGVGPVLARALGRLGIETIGRLRTFPPAALRAAVGAHAADLQRLAAGHDPRPVERERDPRSLGEESTFERDLSDRDDVGAALAAYAEAVARRLRRAGFRGRTVTLKIKLGRARGGRAARTTPGEEPRYPLLTRSRTLPEPTDDGAVLRDTAVALWDASGVREPVRLLGVSVSGLSARGAGEQLGLFDAVDPGRRRDRLGAALDAIADRFGAGAVRRAVADPGKATPSDRRKRGE